MDGDLTHIIGANIRTHRLLRKLTLNQVATELGVSYQQLQKYEKGINRISAAHLVILAKRFGCTVNELCGFAPQPFSIHSRKAVLLVHYFNRLPSESMREKVIDIVAEIAGVAEGKPKHH